ncbi:hypothetical protein EYF80_047997 [Liparis tanakae]|uniref:Uncharacterized protein n=1 Tax=Liparis tanakae TaxID=230148 RepID=A0A4Z2FKY4_9TELE|nr:hypothetical protein EYF80_047997 [Liparis tanakae]
MSSQKQDEPSRYDEKLLIRQPTSLVHGGRQQQVAEVRHGAPPHRVDRTPVAPEAHQKPPRDPRGAGLVGEIRLDPGRHV